MKPKRLSKGVTEEYTSFEEMAKAWGCKPRRKQTSDKEKLEQQRQTFCSRHKCPVCKRPMVYIGGNQMVCKNPECKGFKHEQVMDTGENRLWYSPAFDLLDDKSAEIARNIFADYDD